MESARSVHRSFNAPAFTAPVLVAGVRGAVWLSADGEAEELDAADPSARASAGPKLSVRL